MKIAIKGFEWDAGNLTKCQKHGLAKEEIEKFLHHGRYRLLPDVKHSQTEKRLIAVGMNERGRWIFIAFTIRGNSIVRPITARYMHRKEITGYEKEDAAL
ncbi:MAG: BrnT family toxin [Alphaproteobacteria bacterium]|nr:BrnT family toxin [Alphaproteobacteria bacterium]